MAKKKLIQNLNRCVRQSHWGIARKTLLHPFRILYPWLLEKTRQSMPVLARTFWGGKMKVILPEIVSTHLYRFGYFDKEVCLYLIDSLETGGTFIDIGSHFGSFSLLASRLVGASGQVVAIDPTPSTFALMEQNLKQFAPHLNFKTVNLALYDREGKAAFYDFGLSHSAYNSILGSRNDKIANQDEFRIEVKTQTLDNLVSDLGIRRIDFIKINAESAELAILQGASNVLKEFSPRITVEIGDVAVEGAPRSIEIIEYLESFGYQAFESEGDHIVPHFRRLSYQKDDLDCYNLLFIKR